MALLYKEAGFPVHYRQAEVQQIMGAVYKLRSIAITGLAGMGKSNVVRFIVSHPQVRSRYLGERADDTAFIHVDCAGLARADETEILREFAAQLHRESPSPGAAPRLPADIRRALKAQVLDLAPDLNLALVLDYFDYFDCNEDVDAADQRLGRPFFNYLFHLRNSRPRGNLTYIFVTRRPLGHLYELQELLDDGCVIGPLIYQDALDSVRRDEERLGCAFDAGQRDQLITCSGGHPGFLKNAAELLASGRVDASLPIEGMARQLLRAPKVRNLCRELWEDLTHSEQGILFNIARGLPLTPSADRAGVAFLEQSRLLVRKRAGQNASVFAPLFAAFVRSLPPTAVRITAMPPHQAQVETPAGQERVTLSPKLFALLLALTEARGEVLPKDKAISRVYGDEALGVTDAALAQLIKRLRSALDPRVQRMTGDLTYTCIETVREVGYRFNG